MKPFYLPSFERKQSSSSYVSTSLNGPVNYKVSFNKNDLGSINSKKDYGDFRHNYRNNSSINIYNSNRQQLEIYNEIFKLKQLNYDKEKELNEVNSQYKKTIDYYNKQSHTIVYDNDNKTSFLIVFFNDRLFIIIIFLIFKFC